MRTRNQVRRAPISANALAEGTRPRLMAIGDSLAQGVQTMTFSAALGRQSVAARLAQFNNWDFRLADHPEPVVVDVEAELRHLHLIPDLFRLHAVANGIAGRINTNIRSWMKRTLDSTPTAHSGFDNAGVAQATIGDLLIPAGEWRRRLRDHVDYQITGEQILKGENLSPLFDIFKAINFSYTINPGNEKAKQDWCVLDVVKSRRPHCLLVSIGHNEGLFSTGFAGIAQRVRYKDLEGIQEVALWLAGCEIDLVLWDLLPKVGAVASLEPQGHWILSPDALHTAYAEDYIALITGGKVSGNDLRSIDDSIEQTNAQITTNLGAIFHQAGKSIQFFDDFTLLHNIDYKNEPLKDSSAARQKRLNFQAMISGKLREVHADNRYIYADLRDDPDWNHRGPAPGILTLNNGGLFSGDGMHPTGLGYMHKAVHLQNALGLKAVDAAKAFRIAYEECAFLSKFPTTVNTLALVLRVLHGAGGTTRPSALCTLSDVDQTPGVAALAVNLMSALAPRPKLATMVVDEFTRIATRRLDDPPLAEKLVHVTARVVFNNGISFNDWSLDLELQTFKYNDFTKNDGMYVLDKVSFVVTGTLDATLRAVGTSDGEIACKISTDGMEQKPPLVVKTLNQKNDSQSYVV